MHVINVRDFFLKIVFHQINANLSRLYAARLFVLLIIITCSLEPPFNNEIVLQRMFWGEQKFSINFSQYYQIFSHSNP